MRYIINHWSGRLPLKQAFWINLILISLTGCLIEYLLHQQLQYRPSGLIGISISYFLLFHVLVFIWQAVGVLRSCDHNIKHYIASGWTRSAQFLVLTGFAATLIWGVSLTQVLWKFKTDAELMETGLNSGPGYSITIRKDNTVSIEGTISPGMTRDLRGKLADNSGIYQIELNSQGGNIFEARGIAKLIRENALDTHIPEICLSSCTTAFIAGRSRSLGRDAKLGFHQYKLNSNKLFAPNVNVDKELQKDISSFVDQGVSQAFLDKAFSIPHDDMWFPSHRELIEAGIIH